MRIEKSLKLASILIIAVLMTSSFTMPTRAAQPGWDLKPAYPDYAPSGMPDFDERQDSWYRHTDAVAVWQHFNQTFNDWDIWYSIYSEPSLWWTIGCNTARPLVADSPSPGPGFLFGNDTEPAISWNGSNYAIAVWSHYNPSYADWDIWFSLFRPNVGWTVPAVVTQVLGADYDPAIAFDSSGYAVCVWRHYVGPGWAIAYDVWNPNTMSWTGQIWFVPQPVVSTKAVMPEICVDSQHNAVAIWTDTMGAPGTEQVWYSWVKIMPPLPWPGKPLFWAPPASVPGCPPGINWQKGISPDTLGNSIIDFGYPAPIAGPSEPLYYAKFTTPLWPIGATQFTNPSTNGEHPDVAFDFNNSAIGVYTYWPGLPWPRPGPIYFSFWNGVNWQPVGGAYAASAATGTHDQWPALACIDNNKMVMVWQSSVNTTNPSQPGPQTYDSDMFYSVYTPPYPPGSWTPTAFLAVGGANHPSGGSQPSIVGEDWYVDIAAPTGSPTTPMSTSEPGLMAEPDWSFCGPVAVADSIWWFDSKFEPKAIPPPTMNDGYPLVTSYKPGIWDDHDPRNAPTFIEHLAWMMDCDGRRTKLCHSGTTVWDMQAGITQYLSWSGVNPLGDVDGDGIVTQADLNIVVLAMGSKPGNLGCNLAADIWPETVTGPGTADNVIDAGDLNLVVMNMGTPQGKYYEHTTSLYPDFYYLEEEIERCQDFVMCLGFYQYDIRFGGHFVTAAGVNSTSHQFLISNPIRDDYEAGATSGRSPIWHPYPHDGTVHNNASLVSQDAYLVTFVQPPQGLPYWRLEGYFTDPTKEARIEFGVITSPYPVHDIAVIEVKPYKRLVGQTYNCRINVTVLNEGTETETFNLTVAAGTMPPPTTISTTTVTNLLAGESRTITFTWDTTSWAKSNYTISAYADQVPGETHTADNSLTDGDVHVGIPGEVTGDRYVGIDDIFDIASHFGEDPGSPNWDYKYDITDDDYIGVDDIFIAASHFGQEET